jgi:hypothetical protein
LAQGGGQYHLLSDQNLEKPFAHSMDGPEAKYLASFEVQLNLFVAFI